MELMQSTKKTSSDGKDSSMTKLLREKMSIAASMKSINEVISQAFETKNSLVAQKGTLGNATSGLGGLSSNVPGIGKLIDGISKKKYRETIIVGLAVSVLICFTIWCAFFLSSAVISIYSFVDLLFLFNFLYRWLFLR